MGKVFLLIFICFFKAITGVPNCRAVEFTNSLVPLDTCMVETIDNGGTNILQAYKYICDSTAPNGILKEVYQSSWYGTTENPVNFCNYGAQGSLTSVSQTVISHGCMSKKVCPKMTYEYYVPVNDPGGKTCAQVYNQSYPYYSDLTTNKYYYTAMVANECYQTNTNEYTLFNCIVGDSTAGPYGIITKHTDSSCMTTATSTTNFPLMGNHYGCMSNNDVTYYGYFYCQRGFMADTLNDCRMVISQYGNSGPLDICYHGSKKICQTNTENSKVFEYNYDSDDCTGNPSNIQNLTSLMYNGCGSRLLCPTIKLMQQQMIMEMNGTCHGNITNRASQYFIPDVCSVNYQGNYTNEVTSEQFRCLGAGTTTTNNFDYRVFPNDKCEGTPIQEITVNKSGCLEVGLYVEDAICTEPSILGATLPQCQYVYVANNDGPPLIPTNVCNTWTENGMTVSGGFTCANATTLLMVQYNSSDCNQNTLIMSVDTSTLENPKVISHGCQYQAACPYVLGTYREINRTKISMMQLDQNAEKEFIQSVCNSDSYLQYYEEPTTRAYVSGSGVCTLDKEGKSFSLDCGPTCSGSFGAGFMQTTTPELNCQGTPTSNAVVKKGCAGEDMGSTWFENIQCYDGSGNLQQATCTPNSYNCKAVQFAGEQAYPLDECVNNFNNEAYYNFTTGVVTANSVFYSEKYVCDNGNVRLNKYNGLDCNVNSMASQDMLTYKDIIYNGCGQQSTCNFVGFDAFEPSPQSDMNGNDVTPKICNASATDFPKSRKRISVVTGFCYVIEPFKSQRVSCAGTNEKNFQGMVETFENEDCSGNAASTIPLQPGCLPGLADDSKNYFNRFICGTVNAAPATTLTCNAVQPGNDSPPMIPNECLVTDNGDGSAMAFKYECVGNNKNEVIQKVWNGDNCNGNNDMSLAVSPHENGCGVISQCDYITMESYELPNCQPYKTLAELTSGLGYNVVKQRFSVVTDICFMDSETAYAKIQCSGICGDLNDTTRALGTVISYANYSENTCTNALQSTSFNEVGCDKMGRDTSYVVSADCYKSGARVNQDCGQVNTTEAPMTFVQTTQAQTTQSPSGSLPCEAIQLTQGDPAIPTNVCLRRTTNTTVTSYKYFCSGNQVYEMLFDGQTDCSSQNGQNLISPYANSCGKQHCTDYGVFESFQTTQQCSDAQREADATFGQTNNIASLMYPTKEAYVTNTCTLDSGSGSERVFCRKECASSRALGVILGFDSFNNQVCDSGGYNGGGEFNQEGCRDDSTYIVSGYCMENNQMQKADCTPVNITMQCRGFIDTSSSYSPAQPLDVCISFATENTKYYYKYVCDSSNEFVQAHYWIDVNDCLQTTPHFISNITGNIVHGCKLSQLCPYYTVDQFQTSSTCSDAQRAIDLQNGTNNGYQNFVIPQRQAFVTDFCINTGSSSLKYTCQGACSTDDYSRSLGTIISGTGFADLQCSSSQGVFNYQQQGCQLHTGNQNLWIEGAQCYDSNHNLLNIQCPVTTQQPGTTMQGTTMAGTTQQPGTTMQGTTMAGTTMAGTTQQPGTTMAGTTMAGTTMAGTTQQPGTTQQGTTMAGTTQQPGTTMQGTTMAGTTMAGTTQQPGTTMAGTTMAGTTQQPGTTMQGTTMAGTTQQPGTTQQGTTQQPGTTQQGTTMAGTTMAGTTQQPGTTMAGTTQAGTTMAGTTQQPGTTMAGTTQAGTTQAGTTQAGTTQAGTTQAGTTQAGTTQTITTAEPDTTQSMTTTATPVTTSPYPQCENWPTIPTCKGGPDYICINPAGNRKCVCCTDSTNVQRMRCYPLDTPDSTLLACESQVTQPVNTSLVDSTPYTFLHVDVTIRVQNVPVSLTNAVDALHNSIILMIESVFNKGADQIYACISMIPTCVAKPENVTYNHTICELLSCSFYNDNNVFIANTDASSALRIIGYAGIKNMADTEMLKIISDNYDKMLGYFRDGLTNSVSIQYGFNGVTGSCDWGYIDVHKLKFVMIGADWDKNVKEITSTSLCVVTIDEGKPLQKDNCVDAQNPSSVNTIKVGVAYIIVLISVVLIIMN